jgi:hypothetical protein
MGHSAHVRCVIRSGYLRVPYQPSHPHLLPFSEDGPSSRKGWGVFFRFGQNKRLDKRRPYVYGAAMARELRVGFALTRQERAAVKRAARAAKTPMAEYVRNVVLEAVGAAAASVEAPKAPQEAA